MTDNHLGVEGAQVISQVLKVNTTLIELNLECEEIIERNGERKERINDRE